MKRISTLCIALCTIMTCFAQSDTTGKITGIDVAAGEDGRRLRGGQAREGDRQGG